MIAAVDGASWWWEVDPASVMSEGKFRRWMFAAASFVSHH